MTPALIVIAKEPVPGRVKTRLTPPCTPEEAAAIAEAALRATLETVASCPAARRTVVLDGSPGPWLPSGFDVVPQRGQGLDERLAAAFEDVGAPALLVGMDTPQIAPCNLTNGLAALRDVDAVLGHTFDGGYWMIGLGVARRDAFEGVPMGTSLTGAKQEQRLRSLGLTVGLVETLRDVDHFDDALAVAELTGGNFRAKVMSAATR